MVSADAVFCAEGVLDGRRLGETIAGFGGVLMKSAVLALFLFASPFGWPATATGYQHGVVVRMRMGDCGPGHHTFMASFGPPQNPVEEACPEYTLLSDQVVFVIVGKSTREFVPLAQVVEFRFQKSELTIRVDDERKESKFLIKEMSLRSDWDMVQDHIRNELKKRSHGEETTSQENED